MQNKSLKFPVKIALVYLAIPVFMMATNPDSLPLPLLTIPFLLVFVALYLTVGRLLRRYFYNLRDKPLKGVAVALAGLPVLLIILQSVGQLSIRDLLIIVGLILGLVFYFRKADFLN